MAVTTTPVTGPEVPGNRRFVTATVQFDASYPTGGEAVSLADLGLTRLDFMWVSPPAGDFTYVVAWDGSTTAPKIKVYWSPVNPQSYSPEVSNTTDLSAISVRVFAFGA